MAYGFDFGIWINNNYWYLQACMQVCLYFLASLTIRDINNKYEELKQKNGKVEI